jgi:hypothetical protein
MVFEEGKSHKVVVHEDLIQKFTKQYTTKSKFIIKNARPATGRRPTKP